MLGERRRLAQTEIDRRRLLSLVERANGRALRRRDARIHLRLLYLVLANRVLVPLDAAAGLFRSDSIAVLEL